jgi:alpha-L-fucosidase
METNLFVHFTVNTFTDREWGDGTEPESVFNPTRLDARQWARAAKAGGFRMVVLTAKHHDGFCLWPSRYTEHSVKNSPWKGGKGDVVGDLAQACRLEGLKLGLYLSPWDRHESTYGDSPRYNAYYRHQLTELLSDYGPISEIWFDGACGEGPNGKRQEYDWKSYIALIRRLQPNAVVFSDAGPDIRWIGNEQGLAGDPNWAPVDPARVPSPGISGSDTTDALQHGDKNGTTWRPGECDVSIRPGWFWHKQEDTRLRSVENLVDLYFGSVGRNSVLLLNVPANQAGLLGDLDVQRLKGFRARLDAIFRTDVARGKPAKASNTRGGSAFYSAGKALDGSDATYWATDDGITSGWMEIDLGKPTRFNVASLQEFVSLGQRVEAYHIEFLDGGTWRPIISGTTIGLKKLDRFPAVTARRVRLVIDRARACPTIQAFGLFNDKSR